MYLTEQVAWVKSLVRVCLQLVAFTGKTLYYQVGTSTLKMS